MPSAVAGEEECGPLLSLLAARQFDFVLLFFTAATHANAEELKREIASRSPSCKVLSYEIELSDPKDYLALVQDLVWRVLTIRNSLLKCENSASVSSGTTEMRAIWFALTATGLLPATLLQVRSPLTLLPTGEKVTEIGTVPGQVLYELGYSGAHAEISPELVGLAEQVRAAGTSEPSHWNRVKTWLGLGTPVKTDRGKRAARCASLGRSGGWGKKSDDDQNVDESRSLTSEVVAPSRVLGTEEPTPTDFEELARAAEALSIPSLDKTLQEIGLIVSSAALRFAVERAAIVAGTSIPVLLSGETGTGKELFARLLHKMGRRASKPMVVVNCAAIPKDLAESHLFGHMKGAFTGATSYNKGVFAAADGGTVFLDEIGELPLETQAKFLRVIENGSFTRLGCPTELHVDVRVIAATNRNLLEEVRAKRFREDLFYRLNVAQIDLPPLRNRRAEIPELAISFLARANQTRHNPKQISKQALKRMQEYDWPGNVRELMHTIDRAVLFSPSDVLQPDDLVLNSHPTGPDSLTFLPDPREGFSIEEYLGQVRKQLFLRALDMTNGNQAEAAKLLRVSKQAVWKFLNERPLSSS